eukprot:TRINITY_DN2706_c0_g1_i1.p1 TRINITY_DN2706_c0_g1~~TRINITY_DN2706_c0_g1_i1.p1  ORF type:complete len:271 (-),score=56.95 TRINITY_DN2706_c0_g1_i1:544-1356(-)
MYHISKVPSFVFVTDAKAVAFVEGADAVAVVAAVRQHYDREEKAAPIPPSAAAAEPFTMTPELRERITAMLSDNAVLLFMKGHPGKPRCKFSRQIIEVLKLHCVRYNWFDILEDNDIRQGLKEYSNWPTFPQLYSNGKLVGGVDIVTELAEAGELLSQLPAQHLPLHERLSELVNMAPVMLFMKGTPDEPKCGFSAEMLELLNSEQIVCGAFNVLDDDEVREGLKSFSNWSTFPQLYVHGKLVGGLDVVKQLVEENKLHSLVHHEETPKK